MFGGTAWTRTTNPDGTPGQWYLHLFDPKQPDWNWDNPEVRAEFLSVLEFWLDRGVDGFRVDVAHSLVKAAGLPDLDLAEVASAGADLEGFFDTGPMWDQDGVHEVYRSWRALLDRYSPDRVLVAEAWVQPLSRLARYVRADEMHQAFNFDYLEAPWDAAEIRARDRHVDGGQRRGRRADHLGAVEPRCGAPCLAPRAARRRPAAERHPGRRTRSPTTSSACAGRAPRRC